MTGKLIPMLQAGSKEETRRQKLEALLQDCLDRLRNGADHYIWGSVLRTVGEQWLAGSGHDVKFLKPAETRRSLSSVLTMRKVVIRAL